MATTFTSTTLPSTYRDDYSDSDNYHQILFNSGRALQARELTQLQTLIYEEMSRFGRNIFKEGAAVSSGGTAINSEYDCVKIASTNGAAAFSEISVGSIFDGLTSGIKAKVLRVEPQSADFILDTLYIQYINNNESAVTGSPPVFLDGETLVGPDGYQLVTETPNAAGRGVRFDTYEGDFFVMGRFVHTNAQSIILSPYTNAVDAVVGFKVEQEIITVNDTQDLYDNTGANPNTASPGADRYRIRLTLTTQDKITSEDIFVYIARIENSTIVDEVKTSDAYNKLGDLLATRTNEESGDYIVNPFTVHFEDQDVGDSSLDMIVSAGTAYVNGYRVENSSPTKLSVPKPLSTETVENDIVPVSYGNYYLADSCRGLPDLDYARCSIFASNGSSLGTAHIRAVEKDGENHRVYLFDVVPLTGLSENMSDARRIGLDFNDDYFSIVLQGDNAVLHQTTDNDLLFPTARPRPESLSDITMNVQGRQGQVADGSGVVTMNQLPVGEAYTDTSLWIAAAANESFGTVTVTTSNAGRDAQVSGLTAANTYDVLYYYSKTATRKAKTLTSATATVPLRSVGGINYYDLGVPDIFQVDSARNTNSAGFDMLGRFTLDDGQRDNFYANGRLILNSQDSAPNAIFVNYQHYSRGVSGDFYDATSYSQEYSAIPSHTLQDGTEVALFDYLDFRPDQDSADAFSNIHALPRNGTNITADVSYYLPRADKVIVTQEGDIQVLMGQQAERPQFKPTPDNALELYKVVMNANTLSVDDLQVTPIDHKRYTMADIGKIEAKLDKLEEFTTLSLLELEQRMSPALDSSGAERLESGSVVDDLKDQTGADTRHPDYAASIDPESRMVRPSADEDNVRLVYDAPLNPAGNNVTVNGDQVYLNYTATEWISQSLASRSVNINPFGIVDNVGTLKLSPSSDEWKESKEEAESAIAGATKLDRQQAFLWNNWSWNWVGRKSEDTQFNYDSKSKTSVRKRGQLTRNEKYNSTFSTVPTDTATGKYVSRVVSSDTLRSVINGRVVDLALVPWMRSRKIYFHAKGLKPNTKFTPFFDGQNVSEWCREESTFVRWADRTDDIGNLFRNSTVTAHPDGTTDLSADENGEVVGSFFIPNIKPIYYVTRYGKRRAKKAVYRRFRTGVREFKLLDINENNWSEANSKCFAYYTALGAFNKRYNNILSTRAQQAVTPWSYINSRVSAITPKESRNLLNQVSAAGVSLVDPKLAGLYGPATTPLSSAALAGLDATGQMSQVLSDYISVNENQFAGAKINPLAIPQNPMAQTFYVDNQFGVVLTKVSLFFRTKDSTLPVSVHIRPVENGKPSTSNIVPDSHVFLNPSQVTAIGTDPQLSDIQTSPTDFAFEEPIFLQPWTEYAIVVSSQSTDYDLFSAKTKEPVLGSTSRTVTSQPAPGSLFLPQNGVMWLESKDQDLMFNLHRAQFNLGGGSLILRNARLPATALEDNPIRTTSGSSVVYVAQNGHGLAVGDEAYLDSCLADINGIPLSSINGMHTIDSADIHGYTINVGSAASSTGFGGGDTIIARKNKVFSVANVYVESIIPNFTSIDMSAKFTSGKYISGSNTRFNQDAQYVRVTPLQNIDFDAPKAIYNSSSEDSNLGAGVYSSYIKVDLKTSNDYVSPIIDLQRASLIVAGYNIDDPDVTPHIYNVDETQPYGGTTGSKHITTPITLEEAAVGIEARAKMNLPDGSDIDFYWRTASVDQNINDQYWTKQPKQDEIPNDNDMTFREARFLVGGQGGGMEPFNQVQMKYVFKGKGSRAPAMADWGSRYFAH